MEPGVGLVLSLLMAAGVLASVMALKQRNDGDIRPCPRCGMAMRSRDAQCRNCGYAP